MWLLVRFLHMASLVFGSMFDCMNLRLTDDQPVKVEVG